MTGSPIFLTGTMRTGASLVSNIVSLSSQIQAFNELIHFFRFVHRRYDPLTMKSVERMLHHQKIRLNIRYGVELDVEAILGAILREGISAANCYDAMMRHLLKKTGKPRWIEAVGFQWRDIPDFLAMFPDGKVIHVLRDPRGVLASWREMTFMKEKSVFSLPTGGI